MTWFHNLKTKSKLVLSFLVVCAITGAMAGLGIQALNGLRENMRVLYVDYTVPTQELAKTAANLVRFRNFGVMATSAKDSAELGRLTVLQQVQGKEIDDRIAAYLLTELRISKEGRDEKKDVQVLQAALNDYFEAAKGTTALCQQLVDAKTPEEQAVYQAQAKAWAAEKSGPAFEKSINALDELLLTVTAIGSEMNEAGKLTASRGNWTLLIGCGLALCVSLGMGLWIAGIISRPLIATVQVLTAVAAGDFTKRLEIHTTDEMGQMATTLNNMVDGMRRALQEVRTVAEFLATSAPELSAATEEISSGAQEQASALEETASSMEEITSTVKQNADNAQQANQLASRSREVAEKGGQVVQSAVEGMCEINKSSKQIAEIITSIDEIAFQTNLLALNAAVEAARAGEQGRGFAVVAGEVRNLAQRSAAAAKEIKGLIQDSVRKVECGTQLVNESGQTLQEIVISVKRVTDVVAEIAAASREQSTGIDQVSRAIAQMDQVTQGNASQTEELSGTAESLSDKAEELRSLVSRFILGNEVAVPVIQAARRAAAKPAQRRRAGGRKAGPVRGEQEIFQDLDLVGVSASKDFEEF